MDSTDMHFASVSVLRLLLLYEVHLPSHADWCGPLTWSSVFTGGFFFPRVILYTRPLRLNLLFSRDRSWIHCRVWVRWLVTAAWFHGSVTDLLGREVFAQASCVQRIPGLFCFLFFFFFGSVYGSGCECEYSSYRRWIESHDAWRFDLTHVFPPLTPLHSLHSLHSTHSTPITPGG